MGQYIVLTLSKSKPLILKQLDFSRRTTIAIYDSLVCFWSRINRGAAIGANRSERQFRAITVIAILCWERAARKMPHLLEFECRIAEKKPDI